MPWIRILSKIFSFLIILYQDFDSVKSEIIKLANFLPQCLKKDPKERPTAVQLLFHPALFEVHSLKLLAAHQQLNSSGKCITVFCFLIRGVMILALDPDPERKIFSFFIIPYQDLDPVRSGIIKLLEVL